MLDIGKESFLSAPTMKLFTNSSYISLATIKIPTSKPRVGDSRGRLRRSNQCVGHLKFERVAARPQKKRKPLNSLKAKSHKICQPNLLSELYLKSVIKNELNKIHLSPFYLSQQSTHLILILKTAPNYKQNKTHFLSQHLPKLIENSLKAMLSSIITKAQKLSRTLALVHQLPQIV